MMRFLRWLWSVLLADLAEDNARIRRSAQEHARRLAARQLRAQRNWLIHIAAQVPPANVAEGDTPESVEARRLALLRLYREIHRL